MPANDNLERMKVAFALAVTRKIVNADKEMHPSEVELVFRAFPAKKLESFGFVEPGGDRFTLLFHQTLKEALTTLPNALTLPEKEDFIAWFKEVCAVDGVVDSREEALVKQAEQLLGLKPR